MSLSHMSVLEMNSLSNITELDVNWKTDLSRDLSTIRSKYSWIPKLNQLTNCCCVPCDHCSKWARIIEQNLVKCCALRTVGSSYWHCPPLLSNNNTPIRDAWRMSNLPSSSSVSVCTHCQVAQGYILQKMQFKGYNPFFMQFSPLFLSPDSINVFSASSITNTDLYNVHGTYFRRYFRRFCALKRKIHYFGENKIDSCPFPI